ncbi:albusnodin/ikarugamycin family macrolactam cyclase [Kitasatospora acidiphila]|uniref:asparagine synthase (glutamine-hydrolyzing) n=1 Tax=Kitasatospora acidiphila TaxID=2567942 RepID=A0A540VZI5_9ACTN|nr:albusnodin/ikarugamycin family macrolactam cyclase [Kitasatospora acidiphila]TQF02160.1 albusnodin/ikarugamycin family macrolactam cyclase [Kitasatospora acidiphila]
MSFGGFSSIRPNLRPDGARYLALACRTWRLGSATARASVTRRQNRIVLVLGWCGALESETSALAHGQVPFDATWRWPGIYTIVEEAAGSTVVHTDPAGAYPIYAARHSGTWAWSTSARLLASLITATIDTQRLACAVFAPSAPALAGQRSFFTGVRQLPPGARVVLPADGSEPRCVPVWRPDPAATGEPGQRLRNALSSAVELRCGIDPTLSCDLSGGLDSTSITVLAALALPSDRRLTAVTVHPADRLDGADLRYARLTAEHYDTRISHQLQALTDRHLPYTGITSVPGTDEPAPSTLTQARLLGQLQWMSQEFGTQLHVTGDGGDSILFQPPIHLADLVHHHHMQRAANEAFGWARLRRRPVTPLLRDAIRAALTSRHAALTTLPQTIGQPGRDDHGQVRWFPLPPFPAWGTGSARRLLAQAAFEAAQTPDDLPDLDAAVRVLVDEIREVARTARADAALAAAASGVELHNPFLDALVMDAVLRTPLDKRPPIYEYKPHLVNAMSQLLPPQVAARTTKGSFDADHFIGLRANLADLVRLTDGHLAAYGLLEPARFRQALRLAAAGLPMPMATMEQALTVEAWLTAHHHYPPRSGSPSRSRRKADESDGSLRRPAGPRPCHRLRPRTGPRGLPHRPSTGIAGTRSRPVAAGGRNIL